MYRLGAILKILKRGWGGGLFSAITSDSVMFTLWRENKRHFTLRDYHLRSLSTQA